MENFFKRKHTIVAFALIALIGGIIFLDPTITGNAILGGKIHFNLLSFIGILLIICSIILAVYSIKNRK